MATDKQLHEHMNSSKKKKGNIHNFPSDTECIVKMSPSIKKHHAKRCMDRIEILFHVFLSSTLDGNGRSASCSGCFMPGKQTLIPVGLVVGWVQELVL
jgi:hypothetical protein